MTQQPHESHTMSEWENTIVQISLTPRFGQLRECVDCGGEQAKTAAGEDMHPELLKQCVYVEPPK